MSNKRRIIGNILLVTGLLLLLGAGGLYFYNMIESNRQAEDSPEALRSRIRTQVRKEMLSTATIKKSDRNILKMESGSNPGFHGNFLRVGAGIFFLLDSMKTDSCC